MQAKWGRTAVAVNAAEVTSRLAVVAQTDWGAPLRYLVAYDVLCTIYGVGQSGVSAAEIAFRAALLRPDQDFVLYTDSGAASSAAVFKDLTAAGTRVVSIATPEAQGGEFVDRRTIAFTVQAEYHVANADRAVVSWQESVTVVGNGGPRRVWRFPINTPALRQQVSPTSLVRATQSGQGVGYLVRPTKPLPLFPAYLVNEAVAATVATPQFYGSSFINWPVQWSYTFERGDGPLVGVPSLPPGVL